MKINKSIAIGLTTIMIFQTIPTITFAQTNIINKNLNVKSNETSIINKLLELDKKYENITFDFNRNSNQESFLKFDTIESFEKFIIENEKQNVNNKILIELDENNNELNRSYEGTKTTTKWMPLNIFNIFCNFNTDVSYIYNYKNNNPYFIKGTDVDSYTTGLNIALSWTQTSKQQNVQENGRKLSSIVNGYWLTGVEVAGFPIGFKYKQSYETVLKYK